MKKFIAMKVFGTREKTTTVPSKITSDATRSAYLKNKVRRCYKET